MKQTVKFGLPLAVFHVRVDVDLRIKCCYKKVDIIERDREVVCKKYLVTPGVLIN